MATNYDLLTSSSSVQVLSPTLTQPIVDALIQTKPHGVIMDYWLDQATWDAGEGPVLLEAVAGGVEHIMSTEPVSFATGTQQLDASGLLAQFVTFTVAYQVPGSTVGPATVDVDIPVTDFGQDTIAGENFGLADASAKIQAEYQKLVALAAG